jgi:hypothetical protein
MRKFASLLSLILGVLIGLAIGVSVQRSAVDALTSAEGECVTSLKQCGEAVDKSIEALGKSTSAITSLEAADKRLKDASYDLERACGFSTTELTK